MDEQLNLHNPLSWDIDTLLEWLRAAVPSLSATIKKQKSKPPPAANLILAILQLAKDDSSLCVDGHVELLEKVVANFIRKRIAPTPVKDDVVANPSFAQADEFENDEAGDASSMSLEFEIDNPFLNEVHGFQPELAYRQTWKDFRLIRWLQSQDADENSLTSNATINNHAAPLEVASDEDLIPEDDNLSDLSSGFWREVEEDEQVEAPPVTRIDYAAIVRDEVQHLSQVWNEKKLPKSQKALARLWSSYHDENQRSMAASLKLKAAQHLEMRLKKLEAAIVESVVGTKEQAVKRQCACLQQTVFDHERLLFEYNALQSTETPKFDNSERVEEERPRQKDVDELSDPDAISLNSDSEKDDIKEHKDIEDSAFSTLDTEESLNLFVNTDEEFLQMVDDMPQVSDAATDKVSTSDKSSDESEELDLEQIAKLTPGGRKRKQAFKQSQESKRHQSDAMRRAEEDGLRALQNSQDFTRDGNIPINPGKEDDDEFIYINEDMCQVLKPHQIEGVRFLWREILLEKEDSKATGCLLSHTMGLGKTFQVITLLLTIAEASRSSTAKKSLIPQSLQRSQTLILCPPGLVSNWLLELSKWLPDTAEQILGRIFVVTSSTDGAMQLQSWAESGGILVMGYSMFRMIVSEDRYAEAAHLLLHTATLVIADEAHNLKNSDASVRKAANKITSKRRIALTGSPLSNNIREYWSMIDWVSPSYLGPSKEFQAMFEKPIEEGSFVESTRIEQKAARIALLTLEKVLQPKVHRRDATVLRDMLPEKREFIIKLALSPAQRSLYTQFVRLLQNGRERKFKIGDILNHGKTLTWIANAPAVFSRHILARKNKKQANRAKLSEDITNVEWADLEQLALLSNHEDATLSHKTLCFLEIVRAAVEQGDKTLLFSQSLRTLDYLSGQLQANGIGHDMLRGETQMDTRADLLKSFNEETGSQGKWVLLISTKTGNAGFNIHGANRVVIFDFDWNPTYEEQAIGRAYRLGQRKNVFVYRFVSDGTFESVLLNTTAGKTQLSLRVVEGKQTQNMVSKDVQKFIREPERVVPMSAEALGHWIGHDSVLDRVLELSARGTEPFITELIDAEVFRRERQPEPLDEEQQRMVRDWVERCRKGEWMDYSLRYTYAHTVQMQELMPHHHRQPQNQAKDVVLATPLPIVTPTLPGVQTDNIEQQSTTDASSRYMSGPLGQSQMQAERGASPDSTSSIGERQNVRQMIHFNNHNVTHRVSHNSARKAGPQALIRTPTIPSDVEIIDLTESPPGKHRMSGSPFDLQSQQTSERKAPSLSVFPAFRAAQASKSMLEQSAKSTSTEAQAFGSRSALFSNLKFEPYTAPARITNGSTGLPVWVDKSSPTTKQSVNKEVSGQSSAQNAYAPSSSSSPSKQNGGAHIIRNQHTSPRKHAAPAMSPLGTPLLTTPRRRNVIFDSRAQNGSKGPASVDQESGPDIDTPPRQDGRAQSLSSIASPQADPSFMKAMFPSVQRSTQI